MVYSETVETIVKQLPLMSLDELEALDSHLQMALTFRRQTEVSTDLRSPSMGAPGKLTLAEKARQTLGDDEIEHDFTLADQALLAAVVLAEQYSQSTFSSRDINDMIEECGRPRIAHVTSALAGLTQRSYLVGSTKELSLSPEGKAKAKGLIEMINRPGPGKAA